ncbi:UvrD-helicase domain-containing protein [Clostridium sp. D43t1_170807_H7]|uniref:UvrD-helicase domain-containing protein n=1 Tax=Clostridium sp. D43t1_170807_H7 TaxID=2787140 RepID=UPI001898FB59|nr:UvrD-helicase domain-containing protein [Clostridium sp. D43t1_170807_H7]
MLKSNITIASNVFVRTQKILEKDIDFYQNVTGVKALRVLSDKSVIFFKNNALPVQINELKEGKSCSLAKNRESTHGRIKINGRDEWVCRCENFNCSQYNSCSKAKGFKKIEREPINNISNENKNKQEILEYEYLGINIENNDFINDINPKDYINISNTQIEEVKWDEFVEQEAGKEESKITYDNIMTTFKKIESSETIISENINEKTIVNAGPGTGKTYTVIKRLLYILENELIDPEGILVLCYTRSAIAVIKDRIDEAIKNGMLPYESKAISIYTFDSFATMYLSELEIDVSGLSYNERIKVFNENIDDKIFENIDYLIIDEIQDLVNERAKMVFNIIKSINCGYLLLGDKCQAIYDYDCEDEVSIDSEEFYNVLLNEIIHKDANKYELVKNERQNGELSKLSNEIRDSLLTMTPEGQSKFIKSKINEISISEIKAEKFSDEFIDKNKKVAFLCRNNGEAEYLSSIFNSKGILHKLLRGNIKEKSINRWIGDVFWDYCENEMTKDRFIERYLIRINDDTNKANEAFDILCNITNSRGNLNMDKLVENLYRLVDIPKEIDNDINYNITISTIHRAKGREFDVVYMLKSDYERSDLKSEESRVKYVAVTRAKTELKIIKKQNSFNWRFKKSVSGRGIKLGSHPYNKKRCYCTNLVVGLKDDIDKISYVNNNETNYLELQEYIAKNIKKMDKLQIIRDKNNNYNIYHNDMKIGRLNENISKDFWNSINKTDDKRNIPSKLIEVYVSNIITIINPSYDEKIPFRLRKSKIWLGVEITGFARTEF